MPSFKQTQVDFAAHIRNPEKFTKPESIEERRMDIYRKLFINSISGLLAGSFPVIRTLFNKPNWQEFVRGFYQKEYNKTPNFPEIAREFVDYLKQREVDPNQPFLYELAHYEWIELHLSKHLSEISQDNTCTAENLLNQIPVVSPLVKLQAYQYPVQKIKKDFQPKETSPQPTLLMVWRDTKYQIHFSELNPFSALLLEQLINNKNQTGQQILEALAAHHQHPNPQQLVQFGWQTLCQWLEQDIILTTKS